MDKKHDSLGDRMKGYYENITRQFLPRRTNTIIRLDGKAFHSLTREMQKPFDMRFMHVMAHTAEALCKAIQGAKFAYVQSDEINILLTDYDDLQTDAWFGGNIQKMCSISAAIATGTFNQLYKGDLPLGFFDSRVFTIPEQEEVLNCFIWRQKDWNRNSLQMLARSVFSHKELQNKSQSDMHEMLHNVGVNWADSPLCHKNGFCVKRVDGYWKIIEAPTFTQDRSFIRDVFPTPEPKG